MSAVNAVVSPSTDETGQTSALLRTLVLCDLVDSTALVERLGDREAAELMRKHDRLARTVADRHGGREIDKTDGFLMMFDRPIQAVGFALDYVRGLRQLNAAENSKLAARVGIHVGDVVVWDNTADDIARGAKPVEVEGLIKPTTSRLMSLALPGQILLSHTAYDLARRSQGELGEQLEKIRWRTHGRYRFQGIPEPVSVFEIGEEGLAPLKAPPWSSKAHREVPFWRRPATVVIEALVVAALIAVPIFMFLRPDPAIAFASRDWVVVGSLNNLTGESVFDDALESALRIGLEQSRYVNVLPDLKVRDTVKRMERDPDATKIDRAIGSEVAIRDGARALILPTVAEIGGRVRITAEVIDPQTQTTVYSETADGIGAESVLPSVDTINNRLRVRLGEALATVSKESLPLQKVATKNLDALRAYSLGLRNYTKGQFRTALELYQQAITIDPEFAAAHMRVGAVKVSMSRNEEAQQSLTKALSYRDRLASREALFTEAMLASQQGSSVALAKWQALVQAYPDYFTASATYTYFAWLAANRFDDEIVSLVKEASYSNKNPVPESSKHLLGILYLGEQSYKDAARVLAEAESSGFAFTHYASANLAAQRRFKEAEETLRRTPDITAEQNPAAAGLRKILEASYFADVGDFEKARAHLKRARDELPAKHNLHGHYSAIELGIGAGFVSAEERESKLVELRKLVATTTAERASAWKYDMEGLDARLAMFSWLAARWKEPSLAKEILAKTAQVGVYASYAGATKLRHIASAEIAREEGDIDGSISALNALVDGSELFVTHVALLDSYLEAKRIDDAMREMKWLETHRGRAYAEASYGSLLMLLNVENATLSILKAAELATEKRDQTIARTKLDEFLSAWPSATKMDLLKYRIQQIQSLLRESTLSAGTTRQI